MDKETFLALLAPLALALRTPMDTPTLTVYYRALKDLPPRWLEAAVEDALRQDRAFLPKPGELRAMADRALSAAQAQLTPGPCEACDNTRWVEGPDDAGVRRAVRCGCWTDFREAVAALGQVTPSAPQLMPADAEFDARMARVGSE